MSEHETARSSPGTHAVTHTIADLIAENENLRRKLQTQGTIEQAKGILMGCYGVSADDAFDMLSRTSQDSNTKLHQVAQTIVDGLRHEDPRLANAAPRSGPTSALSRVLAEAEAHRVRLQSQSSAV